MLVNFLFAAQHECNHYTAFKTRWANDVVNRITGFVLLYPRSYERWYHFEHHRHTQDWDRDPELERCLGCSPPTVGYIEFQRRFIAALARSPEPVEGVSETGPVLRRAA